MNKSILLSIKPQWTAKILNGEKTIEIRKRPIPVGTKVYAYCTKDKPKIGKVFDKFIFKFFYKEEQIPPFINGKVVASFVVDRCEIIKSDLENWDRYYLRTCSCVDIERIIKYLNGNKGYALHISQLKIFYRPKELKEFGIKHAPQSYQYIVD